MYTAGFDIGTIFIKSCLLNDGRIVASAIRRLDSEPATAIKHCLCEMLDSAGIWRWRVRRIAATGYGAGYVNKARYRYPEPLCIAEYFRFHGNGIRTVVDIGGLFMRVLILDENGVLVESMTNHTCASGSGRLLETASDALSIDFEAFSKNASLSEDCPQLTSSCAVFAESEIISQFNAGVSADKIAASVADSIAARAATVAAESRASGRTALIGGVSMVKAVTERFEKKTGLRVEPLDFNPQLVSAWGAALLAGKE